MVNKIQKTVEELWLIAQEINKKELSKDEVCKKYGVSSRTFTDLIRNTHIRYKSNKEGYIYDAEVKNKDIEKEVNTNTLENKSEGNTEPTEQLNEMERKQGRPRKYTEGHTELKKLTLEIDKTVYNALQFKKLTEGITINKYIEELLRKDIEEVYFKAVNNLNK